MDCRVGRLSNSRKVILEELIVHEKLLMFMITSFHQCISLVHGPNLVILQNSSCDKNIVEADRL